MNTYRAAIVGLGRMGSTIDEEVVDYPAMALPYSIAGACQASPRIGLVAGADIRPEKRAAFRDRWGVTALYEDYLEMIAQERPDLVAICTRGELHAEMAVKTAEAGVRLIYLEKAIACSMREADAVLDACRKHGVALNTGVLRRFDVRYHTARRLIEAGEIGTPRLVVHYAPSSLLHGHIHSIDTIMYLLGDPAAVSVHGELRPLDLKIEDNRLDQDPHAVYQIEFDGGLAAWTVPAGNWDFEVFGTDGTIRAVDNGITWGLRKATKLAGKYTVYQDVPYPPVERRSATLACLEDLIDAVETGRPPLGNIDVTHRATELCFAVAESHRLGGARVTLPLANRDLYVWHV
ncbi:MAG: Gfo/Idh/MocA family oxidoreductase [Candidatus Latescibacteria bacterium]|nr:Gfo/Idh/MocA family oxidoreductase [Candidatus Latescibacterota bacterium]